MQEIKQNQLVKGPQSPVGVQGSGTERPSPSISAWPVARLGFHSSSRFILHEFDAGEPVWVKIVNTVIRLVVVYLE